MTSGPGVELTDANAMLGRLPTTDVGGGSTADLTKTMDRMGIRQAVVTHTAAWRHDPPTGNRLLLREAADQPRLLPCWVVLPDTCGETGPPERFLAEAERGGVVAVRAYPADHGYHLGGRSAAPLLAALAAARLPLFVDAEQLTWTEVEQIATVHADLPIVVCRTGYRALRELAGVLARTGNVHVDLSGLSSHLGVDWLAERFGAERLIFGTGLPVRDPADAVTGLLWSELDDVQAAAVGGGNLRRLLRRQEAA
ncbi:amidohydrolase family protein [Streptomyces spiralis]|uniref:amidohydrolase family protein n=1 Tax=Streptomyces spiralis TaxID=66376 RepID=UPI0036A3F7E0